MKELSIEEKAKAYDSMFERLKKMYENNKTNVADRLIYERYFPELKESKDEKMIQYFKDLAPFDKADELYEKYGFSHKDAIAWLEKQGGHAKFINGIQIGDKVTRNKDGVLVNLSQLKRIAKPAEEYNITGIGSKNAQGKLGEMIKKLKPVNEVLEHDSAWSEKYIADVFEKVGLAKIAREQGNENLSSALQSALIELGKFMPQPKQEWSEEDEDILKDCIAHFKSVQILTFKHDEQGKAQIQDYINWLKSLKDRIQPQPKQDILEKLEKWLDEYVSDLADVDTASLICSFTNYLDGKLPKSLRPQSTWKPSDEQIQALEAIIGCVHDNASWEIGTEWFGVLFKLKEQLKKLKS